MRRPTRIIVISDLHLGGSPPAMMSFPERLADFIAAQPGACESGEALELVLAGDVIDFLAIELDGRSDPWTDDPGRALVKLRAALHGRDACVFEALAEHIEQGHGLTILVGNHDLELALPGVQAALCDQLNCRPGAIHFVDDGRAWRFGEVLVEHGNRYDDANANDWEALRENAASHSRGEKPLLRLTPSRGSKIVHKVVNEYKNTFEFIDTLQPQSAVIAYLMAALDPALLERIPALVRVRHGQLLAARNALGAPPRRSTTRGDRYPADDIETIALEALLGAASPVTRGAFLDIVLQSLRSNEQSLLHYVVRGSPIPRPRLERVQKTLRTMTDGDGSLESAGPTHQYGLAAARIRQTTSARVVVMGHTHQARHVGDANMAEYINTGTWADLVTIPDDTLVPTDAGLDALEQWLVALALDNKVRTLVPTWAELRVDAKGQLLSARLVQSEPVR